MRVNQYGISNETISVIGEFSILWCAFEREFFSNNATSAGIQHWAEHCPVTGDLLVLCEKLRTVSVEYLKIIDIHTIRYRLYSDKDNGKPERIELILQFLENSNEHSVVPGCFIFIQRIRNNLFHGLKDIHTLNDQKAMFQAICDILDYTLNTEH